METLDKFDLSILDELQTDARLTNAELASRVGLSAAPCWRRVRALEQAGYIVGYRAEIDRHKIGLGVLAFVRLDADRNTGEALRTWIFVMTLCYSRHQYAEMVLDQTVATWLGCHRRAFEWFGAVPARLIIDNAKCAITRACMHDPQVQQAYMGL